MKVLLISHTCQSITEGLPKAQFLGEIEGVELCVLVPDRWNHYGTMRGAQLPSQPSYRHRIGKVFWPWTGPAQWYLHWYPALPALLRRFRPDVIDLWEEPWSLVSAQTCFLRDRLLPHAKIISETEQNIAKHLPPPFETFRSYSLRRADFVVGRNHESIEHLRAKGYDGPARVVPNAVDAELFRPQTPQQRAATRQGLQLAGFVAGYVGRLVPEKGLSDMIEALPLLPDDVMLAFIGEGPQREELQMRADELKVAHRVKFLGARPLEELPPLMNALDALILPSRTTSSWKEQFGRVLIEAGACGVAVIGSDSGAIPEVVGDAGLIFPEGDVAALARAIGTLRDQPQLARQMGRAGRVQAEQNFTWKRVAQQMAQIYQEVAPL